MISIDLPGGPFGGGYPSWKKSFYKSFAGEKQELHLLRQGSHDTSTVSKVLSILGNEKLDLLFIDGDHTYQGVKRDFELYGRLVGRNGIIGLHDILSHPRILACEVHKFWSEIREEYCHYEIVKDRNQGWAGIGVIFL